MESNIYRKKLLNAVLYFAKNTKHVNITKISKLLYFLDFTHFSQTGYPSIGLKYYSFERGPVPRDFWIEVKDGNVPMDFQDKLALIQRIDELDPSRKETEFRAKTAPDLSIFTPRETKIMEELAYVYRDARARDISEVSHLAKQPWHITKEQLGTNCLIDYILAINDKSEISLEEARESLKEHFEIVHNFKLAPTE